MLDGIEWIEEYPVELTPSEKAVAMDALGDAYIQGYQDAQKGKELLFIGRDTPADKATSKILGQFL